MVADTSSVQKLDPDVVTNFLDFQALGLIYDQLVQYNAKLQLVPDLATSWAYSDGNRVLTFQLRKGVTFDDGTTLHLGQRRRLAGPGARPEDRRCLRLVPRQREEDRPHGTYGVKFELSRPDTSILDGLTSVNLSMLSTKAIAAGTLAKTPDGTGPFEFASWSPGNTFVITTNPAYWGGKVTLGRSRSRRSRPSSRSPRPSRPTRSSSG